MTTSYVKTFIWSKELIFGNGSYLWRIQPGDPEIHVDRTLNVWGSGGAHKAYFTHLDEVIKSVFNSIYFFMKVVVSGATVDLKIIL